MGSVHSEHEHEPTNRLFEVTSLSKYLAMGLFIVLPFLGGWIGYTFGPMKTVEVERVEFVTPTTDRSESVMDRINDLGAGETHYFEDDEGNEYIIGVNELVAGEYLDESVINEYHQLSFVTRLDTEHSVLGISTNPASPTHFYLVHEPSKTIVREIHDFPLWNLSTWYEQYAERGDRDSVWAVHVYVEHDDLTGPERPKVIVRDYIANEQAVIYEEKEGALLSEVCELGGCFGLLQMTVNNNVIVGRYSANEGTSTNSFIGAVEVSVPEKFK